MIEEVKHYLLNNFKKINLIHEKFLKTTLSYFFMLSMLLLILYTRWLLIRPRSSFPSLVPAPATAFSLCFGAPKRSENAVAGAGTRLVFSLLSILWKSVIVRTMRCRFNILTCFQNCYQLFLIFTEVDFSFFVTNNIYFYIIILYIYIITTSIFQY